jgi:hypothetical protein
MKGKNIHFGDPGALDILYRVTGGETGPVRLGQAQGGDRACRALSHTHQVKVHSATWKATHRFAG